MGIREGKLLYHLTELKNLKDILQYGLMSRNGVISNSLKFKDIADPEIISFRNENGLNDYVPFHFFVKNPFDGRVQRNYRNEKFLYICVTRDWARNNNFKIIPTHPMHMQNFQLIEYDRGIDLIRWDIMDNKEYRDYHDDNVRNACMAEAVVKDLVDIDNIYSLNVKNDEDKQYIEKLLQKYNISTSAYINVCENWFL